MYSAIAVIIVGLIVYEIATYFLAKDLSKLYSRYKPTDKIPYAEYKCMSLVRGWWWQYV